MFFLNDVLYFFWGWHPKGIKAPQLQRPENRWCENSYIMLYIHILYILHVTPQRARNKKVSSTLKIKTPFFSQIKWSSNTPGPLRSAMAKAALQLGQTWGPVLRRVLLSHGFAIRTNHKRTASVFKCFSIYMGWPDIDTKINMQTLQIGILFAYMHGAAAFC